MSNNNRDSEEEVNAAAAFMLELGLNEDGSSPLISEVERGRLEQHFVNMILTNTINNRWLAEKRLKHAFESAGVPLIWKPEIKHEYLQPSQYFAYLDIPSAMYSPLMRAIKEAATWHPPVTVDEDGFDIPQEKPLQGTQAKLTDPTKIKARDWLYAGHYIRGKVSADVAPGGGGKSIHAITEAVSMATMVDILKTSAMYWRPLKVWYINLEEDQDELDRRLAAIIKYYSESHDKTISQIFGAGKGPLSDAKQLIEQNLWMDSAASLGKAFKLAKFDSESRQVRIVEPLVNEAVAFIKAKKIDVLMVDPTVSSHDIPSENDNVAIDHLVKDAYKVIAERGDCGVQLSHHTPKMRGRQVTAEDLRGASAMYDAVRTARAFNLMSPEDAERFNIADAADYFSIRNGKPNYQRRGTPETWRKLVTVDLGNVNKHKQRDFLGVPVTWFPPVKTEIEVAEESESLRTRILKLIDDGKRIVKQGGGDYTVKSLAKEWSVTKERLQTILAELTQEGPDQIHYVNAGKGHWLAGYFRKPKAQRGRPAKAKA